MLKNAETPRGAPENVHKLFVLLLQDITGGGGKTL